VRRSLAALLVFLFALAAPWAFGAEESTDPEQARDAAARFGQALTKGDASLLRSILPQRGKVQLRLLSLGPGDGSFSAGQVESLIRDFLEQGSVQSFELVGMEHDAQRYALAHGRASLTDRQGRAVRSELHLGFQPEDGRWVLREIRETRP
jgi:hypothetical protein